ncbi:MAG: F0F1 ATP synthase subunit delta [Gammaproteobacteria bacterium]|nr:F0F1 ATP synthase subunit delta [Gammaproteobacteria bacterium]
MADFETAARPYAKAMFELAQDENKLDQWQERLSFAAAVATDADMKAFVEQPAVLPRELGELFLSVVTAAGLDSDNDFDNSIRLLAENSRLAALPAIAAQFAVLKKEAEGEIEVQVRSAHELSAEQQQNIADSMAKRLGKKVSISTDIDDSLIAGAVITAGDLVIDGSASGRIEKLSLAVNK